MDEKKELYDLLDMMVQPVFCVKENTILHANAAAKRCMLSEGGDIRPLLATGAEEYAALKEGCLYLTLSMAGQAVNASVRRVEDLDIFELENDNDVFRALALAGSQLRKPLSSALLHTMSLLETSEKPEDITQLSQLNRSLYQILRILGNMTDSDLSGTPAQPETVDAPGVIREIFEKAARLSQQSGRKLLYREQDESIYCLLDRDLLERAILNILSNALKFTPKDGVVEASLTRRDRTLVLTVRDSSSGIAQDVMGSLFRRHLRQPGIEDSRFGLGLGLHMIQAAAAAHGGTLLICPEQEGGTRLVMTLAIRQNAPGMLHSPLFPLDYSGGYDHSLVELSDVLAPELYNGTI